MSTQSQLVVLLRHRVSGFERRVNLPFPGVIRSVHDLLPAGTRALPGIHPKRRTAGFSTCTNPPDLNRDRRDYAHSVPAGQFPPGVGII